MSESDLKVMLARLEERQEATTKELKHMAREIDKLKGLMWKVLVVAGGAAAGGSGIAKMVASLAS